MKQSCHPEHLQLFEPAQDFGDGQAELGPEAARPLPAPAAPGGQLDPHADLGPHADFLGVLQDQAQLGVFLDDRDDRAPDFLGEHGHLDELGVLEAVADDGRVVVGLRGDGHQLGLRARLEAEPVLAAEIEHFLDHLALLVDLDRVDTDVTAVVLVLRDGRLEGVVDVAEPVAEDVAEADEHRDLDPAQQQVVGELLEVDGLRRILGRMDEDMTRRRDGEIALPPPVDFVELGRVADGEGLACLPVTVCVGRQMCSRSHDTDVNRRSLVEKWDSRQSAVGGRESQSSV